MTYLIQQNQTNQMQFLQGIDDLENSLEAYKRLQYDQISNLIRFNRDMLEVYSNNHALIDVTFVNDKLTEFQNIFVDYLMKSTNEDEINNYKIVVEKFILTLMNEQSISIKSVLDYQ